MLQPTKHFHLARGYACRFLPRALSVSIQNHISNYLVPATVCAISPKTRPLSSMAQKYMNELHHDHFHEDYKTPVLHNWNPEIPVREKQKWTRSRFGHLEHTGLGKLKDVPESQVQWPEDFTETFRSCQNHVLTYKMCNVEEEAERIAEIYQKGIDEIHGNSDYEWHHNPALIIENVKSGNYSIWGTYDDSDNGKLIAVNSVEKMPGQRGLHWIWGAVDPECRGRGVWENLGLYMDKMIEKSGAQYAAAWVATTHDLSQRMLEKVPGWKPVGFYPGGEFLGGTDGHYYRQNVVWYSKLYGDAAQCTQSVDDMVLTDAAKRVVKAVLEDDNSICD